MYYSMNFIVKNNGEKLAKKGQSNRDSGGLQDCVGIVGPEATDSDPFGHGKELNDPRWGIWA